MERGEIKKFEDERRFKEDERRFTEGKMVVTPEFVDHVLGLEVVDYLLGRPMRVLVEDTADKFGSDLADMLMEDAREDAFILRQYRTRKLAEFLTNDEDAKLLSRRRE